jgi:hypothetical protein
MQSFIDPQEYQQFLEFKEFQRLKSQLKSSTSSRACADSENKENECFINLTSESMPSEKI